MCYAHATISEYCFTLVFLSGFLFNYLSLLYVKLNGGEYKGFF